MIRGIWFELDETGKSILCLALFAIALIAGIVEFVNWIRKK